MQLKSPKELAPIDVMFSKRALPKKGVAFETARVGRGFAIGQHRTDDMGRTFQTLGNTPEKKQRGSVNFDLGNNTKS